MSRVLVTGGRGFVGAPLIQRLLAAGEEVHAISTSAPSGSDSGARWWQLDLSRPRDVDRLLLDLRPERLIHLAWYVEHGRFWESPENVAWVEWSLHLLRAFVGCGGARALMLGTCAEYDWQHASAPLRELDSPLAPTTLYGVAKDALRRVAAPYCEREGAQLAWGRLFFLFGPGEAPARLVPSVIRSLLAGEPAETTSGGQQRDFMHVDDAAAALVALARSDVTGPVNIASGQPVAIGELVDMIASRIGRPELVRRGALPDRESEPELLVADVARLREEVGFQPSLTLRQGVEDAVAWWSRRLREEGARG